MQSFLEMLNVYQLALPLLGAYYLLYAPGREQMSWQAPLLLGALTWAAVWAKVGNENAFFYGLLSGAAVVGFVQASYGGRLNGWQVLLRQDDRMVRQIGIAYLLLAVQVVITFAFAWVVVPLFGGSVELRQEFAQSRWPLLLPLAVAVAPAIYEELLFRKLADVWLTRLVRSAWVTALVSSLLWAVMHVGNSGVSPWYLRLIELGLVVGPLTFWWYRRYGLLTVIVAHYLYNVLMYDYALVRYYGTEAMWVFGYLLLPWLLVVWKKKRNPSV